MMRRDRARAQQHEADEELRTIKRNCRGGADGDEVLMADEKVPARRPNVPLEQPPTGGSILGETQERFQSRLNTGTIIDNTLEAEAYRLYMEEMERLAEAIRKERTCGRQAR